MELKVQEGCVRGVGERKSRGEITNTKDGWRSLLI